MATATMRIDGDAASAIKEITIVFEKLEGLGDGVRDFGKKAADAGNKAEKGFKKVNKTVEKVGKTTKKTKESVIKLSRAFKGVSKVAGGVGRAFRGVSKALMNVQRLYMTVVDAGRLATQGITNFGRSMFFFVSLPLIGFMKGMLTVAIDFEDQMVRVGKTTGLWGDKLAPVTEGLRELAKNTSTSHVELGVMAEQVGQLGIKGSKAIVNLTELFNMLSVTTNIAAGDVASKMGKISSAFGWNLNKSQVEVTKLANTINYLENTTAASADEILDALFKVAAVAGTLGISAADATAFATALVSTGFSAEEAGTAVRNLAYYMSQNVDAIHNAMKAHEKYNTMTKVTNELNEDFAQVIIDISDALDDEEGNVNALVNAIEIGHLRGGKALAAFGNSFENLTTIIADARKEWGRSTSLMDEYEKAMSSTKAQMALLRNNINDTGITLGEAFLPYINQLIMVLVPAIRELNEWFAELEDKTKLVYIGFVLLLIIAGPVVMFLGQMMHGVMLLLMGFGQLIKVLSILTKGIGGVFLGISKIIKYIPGMSMGFSSIVLWIKRIGVFLMSSTALWATIIIGAVVLILKALSKMGVDVAGFFTNIANKAAEWGERLMETYGNGLARGFQYVLQVITWIANAIASFFQSSSPPKKGPLNTIDKWGGKLMGTYLKGFLNADFSILSGVGRIIQRYLTFGASGDDSKMASALRNVLKARMALSQLIDIYNKTGVVDQGLLAKTTKGLGHMTKHVQKLIVLWLEYNKIQQRIKDLEKERQDVVKGYQEEVEGISASNMSLEDKVNAIRMAQFARDGELRAIDKEKAALEEQSEEMQEQLKWQQQFVDAMMDQDDLVSRLNKTLEKLAKAMESMGGLGGDIGSELKASLEEAQEAFEGLKDRLSKGGLLWDALKKGFAGEEIDWVALKGTTDPETFLNMMQFHDIGERIKEVYDKLVETWETLEAWGLRIAAAWDKVVVVFNEMKTFVFGGEGGGGIFSNLLVMTDDQKEALKEEIVRQLKWVLFAALQAIIGTFTGDDDTKRDQLAARWVYILFDVVKILGWVIENAIEVYSGMWDSIVTYINEKKQQWGEDIAEAFKFASRAALVLLLGPLGEDGAEMMAGLWEGFKAKVDELLPLFTKKVEDIIAEIKKTLGISSPSTIMYAIGTDIIQGLWDGMIALWADVTSWFNNLLSDIPKWVRIALGMESPSKVMEELGALTMAGYLKGLSSMDADIQGSVTHTAGIVPLAASKVTMATAGGGGGNISVIINDPVVRDDSDLERLAELVADKIADTVNSQQSYGGHTNW